MLIVIILGAGLLMLTLLSVQMSLAHSVTRRTQRQVFLAGQIADSAASQALARIRSGSGSVPLSGGGSTPAWVPFSEGSFYYYSTYDPALSLSTVRAWGRVAADPSPSSSTEAPDSSLWDGTGWVVQGIEVSVRSYRFVPETPLYFGNGAVEKPMGGFSWGAGVDPADPSTWIPVTSSPSSYQSSWVPFQASALDHPFDYIYMGGIPAPASTNPHPYKIFTSQNPIGQFNIEAWFANSAGSGNDPTIGLTPPPTAAYYDLSSPSSPDYPFPVDPEIPDVQSLAWELWRAFKGDPSAVKLASGSHSGTYGDLGNPGVTFVTGTLQVDDNQTFRGAGVLVIRDAYDPAVDTNNTPSTSAQLRIAGTFEWTGLVILSGWAPGVVVDSGVDADATIVGALLGEDSVQSGGEISLDSATISMRIGDDFRVLYSRSLFQPGGLVYGYLPFVRREIVGLRKL